MAAKKSKPAITFEDLATMGEMPEVPKTYKDQLWSTIKVSREIRITEETEHFWNLLCLHFGLHRSDIVGHAINLLWKEVIESIPSERLKVYEEKLEQMRLYRLQQKENKAKRRAERLKKAMEQWEKENPDAPARAYGKSDTWVYKHNRPAMSGLRRQIKKKWQE